MVTNTGDATLTAITVDDPDLGITQADMTVVSGSLAVGDSVVLAYETVIAGDLVNTATASGTPPVGPPPTAEDDAEVDAESGQPSIDPGVVPPPDGGGGPPAPAAPPPAVGGPLPRTGGDVAGLVALGVMLLLGGTVFVRSRRPHDGPPDD